MSNEEILETKAQRKKREKLEAKIKEELKVTVRCLPQSFASERGTCLFTQKTN